MDDDRRRVLFSSARQIGKSWLQRQMWQAMVNAMVEAEPAAKRLDLVIIDESPMIEKAMATQAPVAKNLPHGPQKHRKGKARRW